MHGASRIQHRRRHLEELVERDPSLIDLPISLPSIPLLEPLITLLIGDSQSSSTSSVIATRTPQKPGASHTTAITITTSNPQSPTTVASPSSTKPETGNETGAPTSVNGSAPEPSLGTPVVTSPVSQPTSVLPSGENASSVSGSSPATGSAQSSPSSGISGDFPQNVQGSQPQSFSISISITGDGQAFVSDSISTSTLGSGLEATGGTTLTIGTVQPHSSVWSGSTTIGNWGVATSTDNGSTGGSTPSDAAAAATHHGLSGRATIAIVIVSILLGLGLLLCCLRRRVIAARVRRRREWFAGSVSGELAFADSDSSPSGSGSRSARSSFATTFDRGQILTPAPPANLAGEFMQQVWPSDLRGSIVTVPPASHPVQSASSPTFRNAERSSVHSMSSGRGSRPSSQVSELYLATPPAAADGSPLPSPFFVRPFTPSETWSFPKPPTDDESGRVASAILNGSLRSNNTNTSAFFTAEGANTPLEEPKNPFADPQNPFADIFEARPSTATTATTQDSTPAHFSPVETVHRPFVPTIEDEMAVSVGDQVRVVRRYDDGWAAVESITTGARGLIPIDCMRAAEEELPAFLAKKRISSYVGPRASMMTRMSVLSGGSTIGAAM